jgi:spoIIIJ-associated protein
MENTIERTGKTVDEAIETALEDLKAKKEDVTIDIIEEPNKGIFGIGGKMARVKVTLNKKVETIKEFLSEMFDKMDIEVEIDVKENEDTIMVNLSGERMGLLIGRRGETLDALQQIINAVANKGSSEYKRIVVDTENYRKKREETLIAMANKIANSVMKYKKSITLEPMNPYERRIIHSALQNNKGIQTYSIGEEPNRKVVIALK